MIKNAKKELSRITSIPFPMKMDSKLLVPQHKFNKYLLHPTA